MVDELPRRVQGLAAVAEHTRGIGFSIQVEEERAIDHTKTTVENVKAALKVF